MTDGIRIGMAFGSYDGMIKELGQTCDKESKTQKNKDLESEYLFREKDSGRIAANGYRENIRFSEYGEPQYVNAVIFKNQYQYGTTSNKKEGLNVFDYIQGEKEYAIDFNGNNKVDEGEILSGKIDYYLYQKAKSDGDLNKYKQYLKVYKY